MFTFNKKIISNNNKELLGIILFCTMIFFSVCFAQDSKKEEIPVIINGDKVEFFTELEKVVAEGNVVVEQGGLTLTCDRIVVYTKTKDGFAEGNVVLKDKMGIVEGSSLIYNFDTKEGKIIDANLKLAPYYCVSPEVRKLPTKFILKDADITTCNLDESHYHFHTKEVEITPGDKLRAKKVKFMVGDSPIAYLPFFVQDISEKRNGLSLSPGVSKEWGTYLLTAYRYHFTDEIRGLYRLDFRANKGVAYGFDIEAHTNNFGDSRLQWYFIRESLHGDGEVDPIFKKPERYKLEYRHKWDISDTTQFVMELNDYSDLNFLRQYFYRQYENDSQPDSYMLLTHSYPNSTLSLLLSKRVNQFYSETEKIPEIKFSTNKFNIFDFFESETGEEIEGFQEGEVEGDTSMFVGLYYQNESSITGFTSRTANTDADEDVVQVDTSNTLSLPFKLAFFNIEPSVGIKNSYFTKDKNGSENLFRSAFSSGASVLTKFYRIFDGIKINSHGLEIDKLRHIITPSLSYSYQHAPTLSNERLTFDSISKSNALTFSLQNKLQTKREEGSVDFLNFIISSPFNFKLEEHGSRFEDISFDLEILPNSWMRFESDASFDLRRRAFRTANFDIIIPSDDKGKVGLGYRYSAGGDDSEIFTVSFERKFHPKWKFRSYHRLQFTAEKAIEEQEYAVTRDLHCWEIEFSVNSRKKKGVEFWLAFRNKVFPDLGFDISKSHQQPKTRQ